MNKKKFGRDTKHRKSLYRNLIRSLITHGEITITKAKAKEIKRLSDRLIYKATQANKDNQVKVRRELHRFFGKRDIVNTLVDRVAPIMKDRVSGYTTLIDVGFRRGDNAHLVKLSLIAKPDKIGDLKGNQKIKSKKKKTISSKTKKTQKKKSTKKTKKK